MRRRRPRIGEYRFIDDESGFASVSSRLAKRWDGAVVDRANNEYRNPQEFVRARRDPEALRDVRPRAETALACPRPFLTIPMAPIGQATIGTDFYVGARYVSNYRGAGRTLKPTIASTPAQAGRMTVGCTLTVYPAGDIEGDS